MVNLLLVHRPPEHPRNVVSRHLGGQQRNKDRLHRVYHLRRQWNLDERKPSGLGEETRHRQALKEELDLAEGIEVHTGYWRRKSVSE